MRPTPEVKSLFDISSQLTVKDIMEIGVKSQKELDVDLSLGYPAFYYGVFTDNTLEELVKKKIQQTSTESKTPEKSTETQEKKQ